MKDQNVFIRRFEFIYLPSQLELGDNAQLDAPFAQNFSDLLFKHIHPSPACKVPVIGCAIKVQLVALVKAASKLKLYKAVPCLGVTADPYI